MRSELGRATTRVAHRTKTTALPAKRERGAGGGGEYFFPVVPRSFAGVHLALEVADKLANAGFATRARWARGVGVKGRVSAHGRKL